MRLRRWSRRSPCPHQVEAPPRLFLGEIEARRIEASRIEAWSSTPPTVS
ncbi:hypothetical protein ACFPM0_09830 [Pseudonocardia sulfidoxydans]